MAKKQRKTKASKHKNSGEREDSPMDPAVLDEYARKLEGYANHYREIAKKMRAQGLPVILVGNKKMLDMAVDEIIFRAVTRAIAGFNEAELAGPRILVDPAIPTLSIKKDAEK